MKGLKSERVEYRSIDTEQHDRKSEIKGFLIPDGEVTTLSEGLLGWRTLGKYWELIRER